MHTDQLPVRGIELVSERLSVRLEDAEPHRGAALIEDSRRKVEGMPVPRNHQPAR